MADGAVSKPKIVRGLEKRHTITTPEGGACQYRTDPDYAAFLVRWMGIKPGMRVLDLGAGIGNLSRALLGVGAIPTAVEVDGKLEAKLRAALGDRGEVVIADVYAADLLVGRRFDAFLTNPPWSADHEARMLLRGLDFAPRGLGIISLDGLTGPRVKLWKRMRKTDLLLSARRLSFSPNGATGQEEAVSVQVVARTHERAAGEPETVREWLYEPARKAGR
jgi:predicted RNA methylase